MTKSNLSNLTKHQLIERIEELEQALEDSADSSSDTSHLQAPPMVGESGTATGQILKSISDSLFLFDKEWRYTYVNPQGLALAKKSYEEMIGETMWEIFPELIGTDLERRFRRAMNRRVPDDFEYHYDPYDIWIEYRLYPTPTGLLELVTDITERKRTEAALRLLTGRLEERVAERTAALRKSEERLRAALDASGSAIYDHRVPLNDSPYYDDRWGLILGYLPEEMPPAARFMDWLLTHVHPEDRERLEQSYDDLVAGKAVGYHIEIRLRHKQEHWVWVQGHAIPVERNRDRHASRIVGVMTDITEQKKTEDALRETLEKYKILFESFPLGISISDSGGQIVEVNAKSEHLLGISTEEHASRQIDGAEWQIIAPDGSPMPREEYASVRALREQRLIENVEMGIIRPDATVTWINVTAAPLRDDRVVVTYNDITERKRAEARLRVALDEKETLLRELYHRTKNNMQVMMAMLEMQSMRTESEEMQKSLKDTQNRILSMAVVHERLYQAEDLSTVNLGEYIKDLSELLMQSYAVRPEKITMTFDIDDLQVLIDTAIPCGLVVNEVIANALTHAFPGDRHGEISVTVHSEEDDEAISIIIADNGVGMPDGFDFRSSGSLGLLMIYTIAEQQLRGDVDFTIDRGVTFRMTFRSGLYQQRLFPTTKEIG